MQNLLDDFCIIKRFLNSKWSKFRPFELKRFWLVFLLYYFLISSKIVSTFILCIEIGNKYIKKLQKHHSRK